MKPFFVAFFFMLISQFGHAQADAIDTFLQDQMAKQNIVGLSVGIIKKGKIVKAKGYGYANLENSMPASENTVYKLAPVSKHIIATAIMQFVQEGRLALNDPVGKFFRDTPPHWKEITIKHLLNHTSGLQRESPTFEQMVQKPDSILIKASYSEHNKIVSIAEGLSDIVFANEPPKDDYSSKIDSLIRAKNPRVFNGIVWITKKGDTKYLKTSGYSNLETKTPFT
ncbi:MAG: beta-lactamase family protein [Spirosomaceae bacterium]|nr:beta-lactamase family protein [Spirosomataceae bacterium]